MNEELQSAITALITKTLDGVDTTVDFMQAELPDYIYQLLLWYGMYNFIIFFISLVVIISWICVLVKYYPKDWDRTTNNFDMLYILGGTFSFLVTVLPSTLSGMNLVWLKVWIAPKVWLIEYAGSLVK